MRDAEATNEAIGRRSPALASLLSPLGRRVFFPPDIPFQAAEARGKAFNATIGQITDGAGAPLLLPQIACTLSGLPEADRNKAFLYSPVEGHAELRQSWSRWQRRASDAEPPSTLPIVTVGLTHALSVLADLFAGEGRAVAIPAPFWGNYRQTFVSRTGARLCSAPAYREGRFNPHAFAEALESLPTGEPAVAIANYPSNPGGYSPSGEERDQLIESLLSIADDRPFLVICDDAYAGLVYDSSIPRGSIYWKLIDRHPNLVPVKVDGITKELAFFGGRVGFISFPFEHESEIESALESKVKCLVRAATGSPVSVSQMIAAQVMGNPVLGFEVENLRRLLERRFNTLQAALADVDPELLRPLPFNSGCFALLELPQALGLDPEVVRQRLLARHDTGVISVAPCYLRLAHCSVANEALAELVRRIETAVRELVDEAS